MVHFHATLGYRQEFKSIIRFSQIEYCSVNCQNKDCRPFLKKNAQDSQLHIFNLHIYILQTIITNCESDIQ